jgi:hypothetical protein
MLFALMGSSLAPRQPDSYRSLNPVLCEPGKLAKPEFSGHLSRAFKVSDGNAETQVTPGISRTLLLTPLP